MERGDFRIKKNTNGRVAVFGTGNNVIWTIKALERIGLEISDDHNELIQVLVDADSGAWELTLSGNNETFYSLYSLCRKIKTGLSASLK